MIRFGILGCGMIAQIHADALKNIEDAKLAGVTDIYMESAKAFAQKNAVTALVGKIKMFLG